jgi:hypothetical protein
MCGLLAVQLPTSNAIYPNPTFIFSSWGWLFPLFSLASSSMEIDLMSPTRTQLLILNILIVAVSPPLDLALNQFSPIQSATSAEFSGRIGFPLWGRVPEAFYGPNSDYPRLVSGLPLLSSII